MTKPQVRRRRRRQGDRIVTFYVKLSLFVLAAHVGGLGARTYGRAELIVWMTSFGPFTRSIFGIQNSKPGESLRTRLLGDPYI